MGSVNPDHVSRLNCSMPEDVLVTLGCPLNPRVIGTEKALAPDLEGTTCAEAQTQTGPLPVLRMWASVLARTELARLLLQFLAWPESFRAWAGLSLFPPGRCPEGMSL